MVLGADKKMTVRPDSRCVDVVLSGVPEAVAFERAVAAQGARDALDRQLCLHEIFQNWVARAPDASAVTFAGETLSYGELNRRANRLARRLVEEGVGVGSLVGVSMKRSLELAVGLLAILKAGAAYVPLDPRLPRERLLFLLSDASLHVVLTNGTTLDADGVKVIDLAAYRDIETSRLDDANVESGADNEDLIYVIYTSGSTGEPKGVMVPHKGVVNWLVWMRKVFEATPKDVVLTKAPLTFDVSAWEFFLPLMSGARLVLADSDRQYDPRYLARLMASEGVTIAQFVPSLLRPFLEQKDLPDLNRLRHVMCGGEVFSPKLAALFLERLNAEVCNSYGPTECSIGVTRWPCRRDETRDSIPIGYAIDNTELYILDAELRPVAKNVTGELYIGGVCLARGYLNRPELTAQRFIANPFSPGERMYRTGDLCRFLDDGSIDFLGRADDQVKVRGVRIELGEVEKAIEAHDGVEVAAVVADGTADSASLVAFVVPADGAALTDRELRGFLRKKLPLAMIPADFYFVQSLPVSANGKLDRKALKINRQAPSAPTEAPRDEIEERVKAIWCDLLERDDFGVRDDFFDCGGDSFAAMQLYLRIEEEFGLSDTLDVLDVLTIENLANLLREKPAGDAAKASAQESRKIGGVLLRQAGIRDIEGIWRVCARAFAPYANASLEDFRALCDHRWLNNPARNDNDPFGWVLQADDGHIAGFHGLAPTRLWIGGREVDAIAPTTWAAEPGHARAGLALLSTYLDWGKDRFLLNTTANSITSAMHAGSNRGMTKIPLDDFDRRLLWVLDVKPLVRWRLGETEGAWLLRKAAASRLGVSLASLLAPFALGAVGGAGAALRTSLRRSRIHFACKKIPVERIERFGPEFDDLWNRLKNNYDVTTERTAEILNWRHIGTPRLLGRTYALAARENGKLLGYVGLREPSTTAPGHFIVTDLFYDPARPDAMHNLMNAAFEFAAGRGATVFEVFGFHPSLNRELLTQHPYVLNRAKLERLGRERSLKNIAGALFGRRDTSSSTYWYRAPSAELREICASGSWWPSGIDGDLNL